MTSGLVGELVFEICIKAGAPLPIVAILVHMSSECCVELGGSEKERKGGRNGHTIACDVCLSPGSRAA